MAAASALAQPAVLAPEELYERVAPSVWLVQAQRGTARASIGSGVVVAPGTLVTNCHVVEQAQAITVAHEKQRHEARLQYRDPGRDLCQLHAPALQAPAVTVAGAATLRVGAKVYAVGNPRGLELTITDGLLSGLRRDANGALQFLQTSVPISPGSSGGGLFDAYGRLIGITTSGLERAQNLNFALPADWIAELPRRAGSEHGASPAPPAAGPAAATLEGGRAEAESRVPPPPVFEYRLRDRLTGRTHPVVYRLEQLEGDRRVFDGSSRLDRPAGDAAAPVRAVAGEFELAMPPRGWLIEPPRPGTMWSRDYLARPEAGPAVAMHLRARATEQPVLRWRGGELQTVRVEFKGTATPAAGGNPEPWLATAWYAPELDRIVRFEAKSPRGVAGRPVDELLELVDIRDR